MKSIYILGIRGIPASHGGFETFAEKLSLFLQKRGWNVTVYCQKNGGNIEKDMWNGIQRVFIPVNGEGAIASVIFDLKAAWHVRKKKGVILTLGYNTAVFNIIQRVWGQKNIINMDGIEWKRNKWGIIAKSWFWINERIACFVGNALIADHPEIKRHLSTRIRESKIKMIPYGAELVKNIDVEILKKYSLEPNGYSIVIARPEPENSFLEIVLAFSKKIRNHKLVVLGNFDVNNSYHKKVVNSAGREVVFLGAIYDHDTICCLRKCSRFYIHGHTVGGTNPSLVEALGAGCAIIAQNNRFNCWVAGENQLYFDDKEDLSSVFDKYIDDVSIQNNMKACSLNKFVSEFQWNDILKEYESLLLKYVD